MSKSVFVAGVGMTPFVKPGHSETYDLMGASATREALRDAGIEYRDIQQAHVGWVLGDSGAGQQTLYHVGVTGIPIINVNNACATGATAIYLAHQAIASGAVDCVLALGFEQMMAGALGLKSLDDRPSVVEKHLEVLNSNNEDVGPNPVFQFFGGAGEEFAARHGLKPETYAHIPVKARRHALHNTRAIFRDPLTIEEVMTSPQVHGSLTRLQCCPPTSGAAAAVLVSERFAKKRGLNSSVELSAVSLRSDKARSFEGSMMMATGYEMLKDGARDVYESTGIGPEDVDVAELNDNFASNEVISYEALGLCPEGGAEKFILDGDNTYGGQVVTNPSGGLLAKGHPLGASGVAQCAELTWQLRGQAGARQVDGARVGLQQLLGFTNASVVALYKAHS